MKAIVHTLRCPVCGSVFAGNWQALPAHKPDPLGRLQSGPDCRGSGATR